jgi:SAM-dependent methyltransferase
VKQSEDIKIWIDYWKSLKGSGNEKSDLDQAEFWNKRWDRWKDRKAMAKGKIAGKRRKRVEEILNVLQDEGCLVNGARILDIGSGTGAFAIPLARAGAQVTSLDVSSAALERLRAGAEKEGLSIETIECSWWTADIDKLGLRNKYDLVMATSTPAVKDADCFDRMMGCSKNLCYYSFFIQNGRHNRKDYQDISQRVLKREASGQAGGKGSLFINGFMYLYLAGYRPLIKLRHNEWDMVMDWSEAADDTIGFLESSNPFTSTNKDEIREYYKSLAVDGKFKTRNDGYSGTMVWKVNSY